MKALARYLWACVAVVAAVACTKEKIVLPGEKGFEIVVRTGNANLGQVVASHEKAEAGTVITVSATPIEGYVFNKWTVVSGDAILHPTANPARFTMPAGGVEVAAEFVKEPEPGQKPAPEYGIVVSGDTGGAVVADKETAREGDQVRVYAVAAADYRFAGWTVVGGDPAIKDLAANPLVFAMPAADVELRAGFVVNEGFGVTLAPGENGSARTDKPKAKAGETVTLTATAAEGFAFSKWIVSRGEVIMNTAINPTRFTMPAVEVELGAVFVAAGDSFGVSVESDGRGVAQADVAVAKRGDEVTLTATPFAGFAFSRWVVVSGEVVLSTADNPATFAMPAENVEITAEFVESSEPKPEPEYSVAVSGGVGGAVVADRETARESDAVKVFAIPAVGYLFAGWTVVGGEVTLDDAQANPATFAMPARDVELRAGFVEEPDKPDEPEPEYGVSVVSGGNGTVEADPEEAKAGEVVALTATAADGYTFDKWVVVSGDVILNTALNPTRFTMPAREVEIRAEFAPLKVEHAITLSTDGNGAAVPTKTAAREGERITLMAEPSDGYIFSRWTALSGAVDDLTVNSNPATFTMPDGAVEIGVEFAVKPPDENPITVTNDGNGDASASATISKAGIPITLSATPAPGYEFARWVVTKGADAVFLNDEQSPAARFIMPAATVELRAEFIKTVYAVTISDDGHGSAQADKTGATMQERVTLTATPDPGYEFSRWVLVSGNVTDLATNGTFTMPIGAVEVKAEFVLKTLYINVSTDGKGTASPDHPTAKMGDVISLTAAPNRNDYLFRGWKVISGGVALANSTGATTSFTLGPDDVEVMAMFVHIPREPFILHLDSNGRLAAGQWADTATQDNLLFFKLGSLVGVTTPASTPTGTEWADGLTRTEFYNPTAIRLDGLYADVPGYNDDPVTDITKPEYNTDAMARTGKGDPCRLIGLTAEEAQEMAKNGTLTAYNSGFRTPTTTEMTADYVNGGTTWATVGGMTGRWRNSAQDASTFLPAAGHRVPNGRVDKVGVEGTYWTANGINRTLGGGKCLYFRATSSVVTETLWNYGFPARCVRK